MDGQQSLETHIYAVEFPQLGAGGGTQRAFSCEAAYAGEGGAPTFGSCPRCPNRGGLHRKLETASHQSPVRPSRHPGNGKSGVTHKFFHLGRNRHFFNAPNTSIRSRLCSAILPYRITHHHGRLLDIRVGDTPRRFHPDRRRRWALRLPATSGLVPAPTRQGPVLGRLLAVVDDSSCQRRKDAPRSPGGE